MNLVKIKENSDVLITNHLYDYLDPTKIYLPILKKTTFKMQDYIYKDTTYGEYTTSVSGYVTGQKKIFLNKKMLPAVEITNDFKENVKTKRKKTKVNNKEDLLQVLQEYNLNTIYNKIKNGKDIKNLVISSIDDEVYSAKEFIILANFYNEILETMELLQRVFTPSKSLIVTKNTNFKSIKNVKSIIGTYPNVKIILTNDSYLIGYPKYLCEYLNINENDTLILKTSEIYNIYNAVIKHKSILNNIITISGDNIQKSLVINTKLGVPLTELIDEFITILDNDYEVFLNGYLKGIKVKKIEDIVITNEIDSIIINKKHTLENTECINCGACKSICPVNINVKYCYFNNLKSPKCIGCGLCNYICPVGLKLKEAVMSEENESKES